MLVPLSTPLCLLLALGGALGVWGKAPPSRPYNQILTAPSGAPWGVWGPVEMCPEGTYANGFALKLQPHQEEDAPKEENKTALNGVRLHCSDGTTVQSGVGARGRWLRTRYCPRGYIRAFSLHVEHAGDRAAATDLRMACSDGEVLARAGDRAGASEGPWGDACISGSVCGLQSRVTEPLGPWGNDAALNDIRFFCCPP
uniref:Vitelline membrane outer layer protein 1 homolog n=1 Tax=Pelusios castaneus TaxID=367368 RepID=A0A8C8S479_9SAUR